MNIVPIGAKIMILYREQIPLMLRAFFRFEQSFTVDPKTIKYHVWLLTFMFIGNISVTK